MTGLQSLLASRKVLLCVACPRARPGGQACRAGFSVMLNRRGQDA